jgi:hypothetical protein
MVPDPAGGFALSLPHGMVRLLPPDALGTVFPSAVIPTLPFVAGIVVRSDDLGATARLLAERGVPHQPVATDLLVGADQGAGAALRFVP